MIPASVTGKFSIRTVPNMDSAKITALVTAHIAAVFAGLASKNTCTVELQHDGKWWVASPDHWNFAAAAKAVERVWGVRPDLTREGGSIPVTLTFEEATGKNVLLLPMGSSTDAAHSINGRYPFFFPVFVSVMVGNGNGRADLGASKTEKLDRRNYIEGTKLLGAYLHYIAQEEAT